MNFKIQHDMCFSPATVQQSRCEHGEGWGLDLVRAGVSLGWGNGEGGAPMGSDHMEGNEYNDGLQNSTGLGER